MKKSNSSKYHIDNSPKRARHQRSALSIHHQGKSSILREILQPRVRNSKLVEIRERNHPNSDKIHPKLAQIVLKTYIVKLFKDQKQETLTRSRSTAFGFKKKSSIQINIKLSDQIKKILDSTKDYLVDLKQILADKQKDITSLQSCLETTHQLLLKHNSNVTAIKYNHQETLYHKKLEENTLTFSVREKLVLQTSFTKLWSKTEQIMVELYNKRSHNIHLKESSRQFHHWCLSYLMKGAIVGERLKGLYLGYMNLTVPSNLEGTLGGIVTGFLDSSRELHKQEVNDLSMIDIIMPDVVSLMKNAHYSFYLRNNMVTDIKRVRTLIIGKITNVAQSIVSNNQENNTLIRSLSTLDLKLQGFTEEYERTRGKLLELIAMERKNHMLKEKVCEHCNSVFTEENNFNWSCKTHSGLWGGNMYWCCGQTSQESQGCQKRKHTSKEDNEEAEEMKEKGENGKTENFCTSCHRVGHKSSNCRLDPNSLTKAISYGSKTRRSISQVSLNTIMDIYAKKKKGYKIMKYSSKINELKESLSQKSLRKSTAVRRRKNERRDSVIPDVLNPLIQTFSGSEIAESFPRIFSRRVSSSFGKSSSSGRSLTSDLSTI